MHSAADGEVKISDSSVDVLVFAVGPEPAEEGLREKPGGLGFEVRVRESWVSSARGVRWKASFEIREDGKSRSGSAWPNRCWKSSRSGADSPSSRKM